MLNKAIHSTFKIKHLKFPALNPYRLPALGRQRDIGAARRSKQSALGY
jgi:hypothetical protein